MSNKKEQDPGEVEYLNMVADIRELMSESKAKTVIWHILGLCGIYSNSFTGNSTSFFNAGRQDIGLQVIGLLNDADPTIYPRLLLEYAEKETP